jgi:hypothetical protein
MDVRENTPEGADGHLLRMIDSLKAATPAPTVNGRYYAELMNRDAWKLGPRLTQFWDRVRERVLVLTPRTVAPEGCPFDRVASDSLVLDRPEF